MLSDATRVIAASSPYWIVGSIWLNEKRIQDILNDANTSFARFNDAQIYADADRTSCVAALPYAMVPKDRIELVILPEARHEAPIKRWNNFNVRTTAKVSAVVSRYFIEGELQLPPSTLDVMHVLTQQLGSFFPIVGASIVAADSKRMSVPVVFANKRFLSCFNADDPANAEDGAAELESSLNNESR
jgi:hypothetical protein